MRYPSKTFLVIDCNYLCRRAFHAFAHKLSTQSDDPTAVLFGFFRDIISLQEEFMSTNMIFCFDGGNAKRLEIYPDYKITRRQKRKKATRKEKKAHKAYEKQVKALRTKHLPELGFRNILWEPGFEADDHIASFVQFRDTDTDVIIVSADEDLWQCIDTGVICYNPQKKEVLTLAGFRERWEDLLPLQWPLVKALAGCGTDDIKGAEGVGEITAVRWFMGTLRNDGQAYKKCSKGLKYVRENRPLVELPFTGTPLHDLRKDKCKPKKWRKVTKSLEMVTLIDSPPLSHKKGFNDKKEKKKKSTKGESV